LTWSSATLLSSAWLDLAQRACLLGLALVELAQRALT
jgi:hypothetical protein